MSDLVNMGKAAKIASRRLATLSTQRKNEALLAIAGGQPEGVPLRIGLPELTCAAFERSAGEGAPASGFVSRPTTPVTSPRTGAGTVAPAVPTPG